MKYFLLFILLLGFSTRAWGQQAIQGQAIYQLPNAAALTGAEFMPLDQGNPPVTYHTTVANLLNLGNASGILSISKGGTGTATPSLIAGANVTITGAWPNQTIAASGGGGGGGTVNSGTAGQVAYYASTGTAVNSTPHITFTAGGVGIGTSSDTLTLTPLGTGAVSVNAGVASAGTLAVANGGTAASSAGITSLNNITGYSFSGLTGSTSTYNLVGSNTPTLTTPVFASASGGSSAGSTLALSGTTSGSPSAAYILLNSNGQSVGVGTTAPTTMFQVGSTPTSGNGCNISSSGVMTNCTWQGVAIGTAYMTGVLPVANGGTAASTASITSFNNITGLSAAGTTGTTSTNLVFSTSPALTTPTVTTSIIITDTGATTAFAAGNSGATNPAFAVSMGTTAQAAGLLLTGAATGGTILMGTTDSGSANNFDIEAKGSGKLTLAGTSTGNVLVAGGGGLVGIGTATPLANLHVHGGGIIDDPCSVTISSTTFTPATFCNVISITWTSACSSGCTVANPSFTLVPGQKFFVEIKQYTSSGAGYTCSFGNNYDFGAAGAPTCSTTANAVDVMACYYSGLNSKINCSAALGF